MSVRVGILGCARITKAAIIDVIRDAPELSIVAVASRSHAKALAYAREHGIPKSFGAYEDLLADPAVDAVYVPLPNGLHATWTIAALEAGKAVLCEKPLASNSLEASGMADAARRLKRPLMEAFHYRYHPMMRYIVEVVEQGRLGRLRSVHASLEVPGHLIAADDIRFQSGLAGGAMMDVGAYCMNIVRLVTKEEPHIEHAQATLASAEVDSAMQAALRFPSGTVGEISCSLAARRMNAQLRIIGDRGSLDAWNPFLPQMGHRLSLTIDGKESSHTFDMTATYVFQARAFAAVVRGETCSLSPAEDGVANMKAIDQVYRMAGLFPRG